MAERCVKLGPPRSDLALSASRPLLPVIEGKVETQDISDLQFAYDQGFTLMASFVKQMAVAFGMTLTPLTLRHAVLAYSMALEHRGQNAERLEFHMATAVIRLLQKVRNPISIDDADIFATMILAWVGMRKGMVRESITHSNGGLSLLNHLSQVGNFAIKFPLLDVFEPLLRDNFNTVLATYGVLDTSME